MGKGYRTKGLEMHDFYCINCGNKNISLFRKMGYQHGKAHRKVLWCPTCKTECNCIECRNETEVEEFLIDFKNGVYKDEAKESLDYVRSTSLW